MNNGDHDNHVMLPNAHGRLALSDKSEESKLQYGGPTEPTMRKSGTDVTSANMRGNREIHIKTRNLR